MIILIIPFYFILELLGLVTPNAGSEGEVVDGKQQPDLRWRVLYLDSYRAERSLLVYENYFKMSFPRSVGLYPDRGTKTTTMKLTKAEVNALVDAMKADHYKKHPSQKLTPKVKQKLMAEARVITNQFKKIPKHVRDEFSYNDRSTKVTSVFNYLAREWVNKTENGSGRKKFQEDVARRTIIIEAHDCPNMHQLKKKLALI